MAYKYSAALVIDVERRCQMLRKCCRLTQLVCNNPHELQRLRNWVQQLLIDTANLRTACKYYASHLNQLVYSSIVMRLLWDMHAVKMFFHWLAIGHSSRSE